MFTVAFAWAVSLFAATPAEENAEGFGQPVLVMIGRNPWLMVMGSESASFVLYENRIALFIANREGKFQRSRAMLTSAEYEAFLKSALGADDLDRIPAHTSLTSWTDQMTTELVYRRADGRLRRMSVYGSFDSEGRLQGVPTGRERRPVVERVPDSLLKAFREIGAFSPAKAEPWSSKYLEVMIWAYNHAPDKNLPWPAKWPGLGDPNTIKDGGPYDSHRLFLPASEEQVLVEFLKSRREKQAVLIDGRKWAVSFRRPLPREKEWSGLPRGD
ncbi:MAG: hypothetical protein NTV51_27055 [Verrucomicrobia bacterium]|nr:hypothetical protein [Verrucomicrobiota bacterium]